MRSFRHITPRYVFYRTINIWYQKRYPDYPWLTPQAIQILQSWIHPKDKGVEWGTGRSTIWFGSRVAQLLSIEHDPAWYEKTHIQLKKNGLDDVVDYRLFPLVEKNSPPRPPLPIARATQRSAYANVVNEYPDENFDFALIDGKIRHVCMALVLPKIRPGGLIILDNSERYVPDDTKGTYILRTGDGLQDRDRQEWKALLSKMNHWRTITTTNGVWRTRFWVKPC